MMTSQTLALALVLAACSGAGSTRSQPPGPVVPSKRWTTEQLVARGAVVTPISERETLVCVEDGGCVCLVKPDCAAGGCPTRDESITAFTTALDRDTHPVDCELADTGRLCDLSYFRFEGDIHRLETRYFDASGAFLAQTNATDSPAYCDDRASMQIEGVIPECTEPTWDVKVLCSEPDFAPRAGQLPRPIDWIFGYGSPPMT